MIRYIILISRFNFLLIGALFLFLIGWPQNTVAQNDNSGRFKTVVIDAGHGGRDPGAVGKDVKEKDIVLAVALKVGEYLKRELPEVKVVYTRTTDVFVPLDERAEVANKAKADLFVSIHANAISNPRIYGAETFVLGLHRSEENLEVAKKENSVIVLEEDYTTKYEGFDPNSPESYIIFELMQNVYLDQSISAASIIQEQFETRVGRRNRGVKQAGFLVLRKTSMPGVLVELGFLSNRSEERFMASEEGQVYLASAIFRSIRDYKNRYEARNNLHMAQGEPTNVEENMEEMTPETTEDFQPEEVIEFRIQVASSARRLSEKEGPYLQFDDVWNYQDGQLYKYTTGVSASYEQISDLLMEVRKIIPDSFIIAFKDGERVPVSSVRD
ncbi:N-acetylmuramoyl-L-alanine amidase family protein [Geofilum rubicundum]|uniref:N-acetylmuramoyl-L-alanine amidase n=1 Tax=Geofilum rubicundum JCM 15548 TaxID=1236989 RepID=A0A0E9M3C4_9BACT|nr:N-acetylmuramoyl-L-alanine amidase [Geofilum rubicundum]GAO31911.1 N-acetylmuramoyl-L-alanine amidase [Geofilum rubicundum JCM 15548]